MQLRQFEYLSALAREQHFARAAAACHVSQPALSEGIRRLEADLGVQLVRRSRSFEGFTPEGERVVHWARQILANADEMRSELSNMREGLSGRLRVAAIPTALAASSLITSPFLERHPRVRVAVESMSSREIVAHLTDFRVDVGISYVDGEPLGGSVRTVPLYAERYLLLTPADGPLVGREIVEWSDLADVPLCLLSPDMQNRRIIDRFLADAGVHVQPAIEADAVSVLYGHAATGRWSTVVAHTWLHLFGVPDGLRAIPMVEPATSVHVGLLLPDTDPQPILVQAFLEVATRLDATPGIA
jgi:DNA-binding transcriptional LysR family regulator